MHAGAGQEAKQEKEADCETAEAVSAHLRWALQGGGPQACVPVSLERHALHKEK